VLLRNGGIELMHNFREPNIAFTITANQYMGVDWRIETWFSCNNL